MQDAYDRQEATDLFNRFVDKMLTPEQKANPQILLESFSGMDYDQFISMLQRMNGILRNANTKDRASFENDMMTKDSFGEIDIVFPPKEESERIMKEIFEKLKLKIEEGTEDSRQAVALTLFNALIYLHPMKDGNGRTARALYFMTSPSIDRNQEEYGDQLKSAVSKGSYFLSNYHFNINRHGYFWLLSSRNIPTDFIDDGDDWAAIMMHEKDAGFDEANIMFISAYDVMTEEERKQYAISLTNEGPATAFNFDVLPKELQNKIKENMPKVRTEFAELVLQGSLENAYDPYVIEMLNKDFAVKGSHKLKVK